MPVYRLSKQLVFPPPDRAEPDGLLAVGGDLDPRRLVLAYSMGIFPWYSEGYPILWHSPDPRTVLPIEDLRVRRSLRQAMRKRPYTVSLDRDFDAVIAACAQTPRPGQDGTWITDEMADAYRRLHRMGLAHSVEVRDDAGALVGGLYGVCIGHVFCGESMFARASDASKVGFVKLVRQLARWDIRLIDCQVHTEHLASFGAVEWPRPRFLEALTHLTHAPTRQQRWSLDPDLACGPDPGPPPPDPDDS